MNCTRHSRGVGPRPLCRYIEPLVVGLLAVMMVSAWACAARSKPAPSRAAATKSKKARPSACPRVGTVLRGKGVWYGGKHHGGKTASGERFNKNAMTAAHKTLPLGTVVRVTNLRNQRSVRVRINDRGPYGKRGRIIDVAEAAARKLDMIRVGVVPVRVEVVKMPAAKRRRGRCR